MFHIKICGVRSVEDVRAVASAGADAIGLNFFSGSVRFVDPLAADTRAMARTAAIVRLLRVGVFVNATAKEIGRIVGQVGIDVVQLHGDETLEFASQLIQERELAVIRAIKLPTGTLTSDQIEATARPWMEVGCHPLLDADAGTAHGGSGKTLDWDAVREWSEAHQRPPFTLAGGLTPENVASAIDRSGATSVDTASGVERPRGVKSRDRMDAFTKACQSASSWQEK